MIYQLTQPDSYGTHWVCNEKLSPSEHQVMRTFNGWPVTLRQKVQAWIDTLPNRGSQMDLDPLERRKVQRWWKAFLNSKPL